MVQGAGKGIFIEAALRVQPHNPKRRPRFSAHPLPRQQVAMMLGRGNHHRIARAQALGCPGSGNQVQRLGGVSREGDLFDIGPNESGEPGARLLERIRCSGRYAVEPTRRVGRPGAVIAAHRFQHALGNLRGGRVVQVDEFPALQGREFAASLLPIIVHGGLKPLRQEGKAACSAGRSNARPTSPRHGTSPGCRTVRAAQMPGRHHR